MKAEDEIARFLALSDEEFTKELGKLCTTEPTIAGLVCDARIKSIRQENDAEIKAEIARNDAEITRNDAEIARLKAEKDAEVKELLRKIEEVKQREQEWIAMGGRPYLSNIKF